MTEFASSATEFDLQPDPRILPMLGEINLTQWRCLAEFVDNSVDGFLTAKQSGQLASSPSVHIAIPTSDSPNAKITVRDNGPGMSPGTLQQAVRAGWTSNDPISSLGMFGMGFNIATARLGTVTRVWTTQEGHAEWYGLEIDFDKLRRQRHFRTPKLTRPKINQREHGTEISVERLKPEQRAWFSRTSNRSNARNSLGRAYSAMIRTSGVPISFELVLNGNAIKGREHCIWGGDLSPTREVQTSRYGLINAYQVVDRRLADRPFCTRCWQWLPSDEETCPSCESADYVVVRERRIHGWLGIQRYLSQTDYGIDFLRHGRKIEMASRELFQWNNGETPEPDYPIDDPRNRGRIVGEIHLDHCRVMYTKDRFDRNDPAWDEMLRIVRGDGPLRPDKATDLGYGPNDSPLFLLFQAFRRSTPKPKVAGSYAKLLIVPDNDRAEEMAKHFRAEEAEYQTDRKWMDLVEEADRQLLTPDRPPIDTNEDIEGFEGFSSPSEGTNGSSAPAGARTETAAEPQPPYRVSMPSLSQTYRSNGTNVRWEVRAYRVDPSDPELNGMGIPWSLKATTSGIHEFLVNTAHDIFRSATMTPIDALLAELASSAIDFQRGNSASQATFASLLADLREQYAGTNKLDSETLSNEAALTLSSISRNLFEDAGPEDGRALFEELAPAEQEAVYQRMANRSVPNPQQILDEGRFLEFAPYKTLLRFLETHPELFFDGRYWDVEYATLDYGRANATEAAQAQILRYYASLLTDAVWLAEQDPTDLAEASRARLLRAALALELLTANVARESNS
jgi:hypothetical protein